MKNKKIVLVGNYGNDNNGDEAILLGLIKLLHEKGIRNEDMSLISNNPEKTYSLTGISSYSLISKKSNYFIVNVILTIFLHFKLLLRTKKVIFGGGGTMMDMYRRDLLIYSSISSIAKLTKNDVYIFGVGAGPLSTKLGKNLMRLILKQAKLISVRDFESQSLLSNYTNKKVEVVSDLAFFLDHEPTSKVGKSEKVIIGVTTLPYFSDLYWPNHDEEKYKTYLKELANSLKFILNTYPDVHIKIFATKYPEDTYSNKDLFEYIDFKTEERVELINDNLNPLKLLETMSEMDIIIGTRLHSIILATILNKPVIALGYHQKVRGYMKKYEIEHNLIDISYEYESNLSNCLISHLNKESFYEISNVINKEKELTSSFGDQIIYE